MRNKANPRRWNQPKTNKTEDETVDLIDQLTQFEDFKNTILPILKKDVEAGMTAEELRIKYAALAQARVISEALTNPKAGDAIFASKDILDRAHGKATEKKEIKHRFDSLNDEELDAVLESEIGDLDDIENRFEQ